MYTSNTYVPHRSPEPNPSFSRPLGLRVRVAIDTTQQILFGDAPSVVTDLAERLCVLAARVVVSDFRIHSQLERTVPAVIRNVRLSFWSCAKRAAFDCAAAFACGAKRRVIQPELAIEAANVALRIAELCGQVELRVRAEKLSSESCEGDRRSALRSMYRSQREARVRRLAEASLSDEEVAMIEREMNSGDRR